MKDTVKTTINVQYVLNYVYLTNFTVQTVAILLAIAVCLEIIGTYTYVQFTWGTFQSERNMIAFFIPCCELTVCAIDKILLLLL